MKSSKSEVLYFILTILVVSASAFLYVVFGNRHIANINTTNQTLVSQKESTKDEDVVLAGELLEKLDKELTNENLGAAQSAIDLVAKPEAKEDLQNKLNALAAELDNQKKAEELVVQAEAYLSYPNFELAQTAVNELTKEAKKGELQTRLNTVKANLDAYTQANNTGYTGNTGYAANTGYTGQ